MQFTLTLIDEQGEALVEKNIGAIEAVKVLGIVIKAMDEVAAEDVQEEEDVEEKPKRQGKKRPKRDPCGECGSTGSRHFKGCSRTGAKSTPLDNDGAKREPRRAI
jgi:hypothetical protein